MERVIDVTLANRKSSTLRDEILRFMDKPGTACGFLPRLYLPGEELAEVKNVSPVLVLLK